MSKDIEPQKQTDVLETIGISFNALMDNIDPDTPTAAKLKAMLEEERDVITANFASVEFQIANLSNILYWLAISQISLNIWRHPAVYNEFLKTLKAIHDYRSDAAVRARIALMRGLTYKELADFLPFYTELPDTTITTLASQLQNNYAIPQGLILDTDTRLNYYLYRLEALRELKDTWQLLMETIAERFTAANMPNPLEGGEYETLHILTVVAIVRYMIIMEGYENSDSKLTNVLKRMEGMELLYDRRGIEIEGQKESYRLHVKVLPTGENEPIVTVMNAPVEEWRITNGDPNAFKKLLGEIANIILFRSNEVPVSADIRIVIKPDEDAVL